MRPPSQQLAEAAEAAGEHTHDIDLRSEPHKRAERVLGKGVHPAALGRLYELWPTAHVRVQHSTERVLIGVRMDGNEYETRRVTLVTIHKRGPGMPAAGKATGSAVCAPGDQWDRRRGIDLAFRRALDDVRRHVAHYAAHPGLRPPTAAELPAPSTVSDPGPGR